MSDQESKPVTPVLGATGGIGPELRRQLVSAKAGATYAGRSIHLNCVAPGLVCTPLTRSITDDAPVLRDATSLHAMPRIDEPAEVSSAVHWLLDPAQSWITGQVIGVGGGLAIIQPTRN